MAFSFDSIDHLDADIFAAIQAANALGQPKVNRSRGRLSTISIVICAMRCLSRLFVEGYLSRIRPGLVLVLFDSAVPVFSHFLRWRDLERADDAEAEELGVGVVPDALGQLRVLHLPRFIRAETRGTAEHFPRVIPRTTA